ncbi:hypothetical protein K5D45_24770, partial [Pseudomonas cichorii]
TPLTPDITLIKDTSGFIREGGLFANKFAPTEILFNSCCCVVLMEPLIHLYLPEPGKGCYLYAHPVSAIYSSLCSDPDDPSQPSS